jgi:hypothetical protein
MHRCNNLYKEEAKNKYLYGKIRQEEKKTQGKSLAPKFKK